MGVLDRINELAKKAKERELTAEEIAQRDKLRQEYLKNFRSNFEQVIDNVYIEDEDGNAVKIKKNKK